jgi:hypothetical protein
MYPAASGKLTLRYGLLSIYTCAALIGFPRLYLAVLMATASFALTCIKQLIMPLGMKRTVLQAVAQAKLDDARLLLQNGRFSNAYYLAGYAIEIGLKACIAKQISADTIPDKNFVNAIFQHGLKGLVSVAGLSTALKEKETNDPIFATNWGLVAGWTPEVRYDTVDNYTAQLMLQAVADDQSGVFAWIKANW